MVELFDRRIIGMKRTRAEHDFDEYRFLFDHAAAQLSDRMADIKREFKDILHIGSRGACSYNGQVIDINSDEILPVEIGAYDLIFSNLELHSTNNLPQILFQIRHALKADGMFIGAMFGGETLRELRESFIHAESNLSGGISPRVLPFADKPTLGGLLQSAGFALPVVDSDILTVTYPSLTKLMHDLRGMGEGSVIKDRLKRFTPRGFFDKAAEYYAQKFSDVNGRLEASFEIIYLIGWAPHESQQQPLKPGSAKTRLADALGTDETKI